jgi:hypothetical protein
MYLPLHCPEHLIFWPSECTLNTHVLRTRHVCHCTAAATCPDWPKDVQTVNGATFNSSAWVEACGNTPLGDDCSTDKACWFCPTPTTCVLGQDTIIAFFDRNTKIWASDSAFFCSCEACAVLLGVTCTPDMVTPNNPGHSLADLALRHGCLHSPAPAFCQNGQAVRRLLGSQHDFTACLAVTFVRMYFF